MAIPRVITALALRYLLSPGNCRRLVEERKKKVGLAERLVNGLARKAKPTISTLKFDYLVLCPGYTVRLVSHFLDLGAVYQLEYDASSRFGETGRDVSKDRLMKRGDPLDNVYERQYADAPDYEVDGIEIEEVDDYKRVPDIAISIVDTLWGEGHYYLQGRENEAKEIQRNVSAAYGRLPNGTITFAPPTGFSLGDTFRIMNNMIKLRHCACFGPDPITCHRITFQSAKGPKTILYLEFDTESG
ncbi:MAG: hypothetical protein KGL39_01055 [Patescibacteria group bacterium]|nr:hypothetical protein [Patescibacteria group bacterium]